jgi:hypothetical protein
VSITPTFVINKDKKISGLPANFSEELCSHIALTSTVLAASRQDTAASDHEDQAPILKSPLYGVVKQ